MQSDDIDDAQEVQELLREGLRDDMVMSEPRHRQIFRLDRWPYFALYAHEKRLMRRRCEQDRFFCLLSQSMAGIENRADYLDDAREPLSQRVDREWRDPEPRYTIPYDWLKDSYVYVDAPNMKELRDGHLAQEFGRERAQDVYLNARRNMAWMWRWSAHIREEEYTELGRVISWETLRRWRIKWLENAIRNAPRNMRSQDDRDMEDDVRSARQGLNYVRAKYGDREDDIIVRYVTAQENTLKKA
jgi:hypothetical protein